MCGEDGAQREVYKLKEEPGKKVKKRGKKEKRRTKKQRERREKKVRRESGIIHRGEIFVRPTLNLKQV